MPATKKVSVTEDTRTIHDVIEEHAQPQTQLHALAFNKRFNQLKEKGLSDHEINIILLGELAYNVLKSK